MEKTIFVIKQNFKYGNIFMSYKNFAKSKIL